MHIHSFIHNEKLWNQHTKTNGKRKNRAHDNEYTYANGKFATRKAFGGWTMERKTVSGKMLYRAHVWSICYFFLRLQMCIQDAKSLSASQAHTHMYILCTKIGSSWLARVSHNVRQIVVFGVTWYAIKWPSDFLLFQWLVSMRQILCSTRVHSIDVAFAIASTFTTVLHIQIAAFVFTFCLRSAFFYPQHIHPVCISRELNMPRMVGSFLECA